MQAMGVQNVRILVPWGLVEPVQGTYNWSTLDYIVNAANQRNMGVLGVINSTPTWDATPGQPTFAGAPTSPQDYAAFAGLVAQRYAGKISAYEVWNEPNVYSSWAPKPDPAAYTQLLQAAYPAIKAADPNAEVIGGVLMSTVGDGDNYAYNPVDYLQQMYADGAKGYFDALSFHPYHYTLPFSEGGPYGTASAINQMTLMHQLMINNGDGSKQIWASEYGEPTTGGGSEAMQASFIQDFINTWSGIPYAGPSFIYTLRDVPGSTAPQDNFGVLRSDWTWKPAATVIQQWIAAHPQNGLAVQLAAALSPMMGAMSPPAVPIATTAIAAPATVDTAVATAPAGAATITVDPPITATSNPASATAATPTPTTGLMPTSGATSKTVGSTSSAGLSTTSKSAVSPTTSSCGLLNAPANCGLLNGGAFNNGALNNIGDAGGGGSNQGLLNNGSFNQGVLNSGSFNQGVGNNLLSTGGFNQGILNGGSFNQGVGNNLLAPGGANEGILNQGVGNQGILNVGAGNIGILNFGTGNNGILNVGSGHQGILGGILPGQQAPPLQARQTPAPTKPAQ